MNLTESSNVDLLSVLDRKIAGMTDRQLQDQIDEYIALIDMGLLRDAFLNGAKKRASILAHILLRRQK